MNITFIEESENKNFLKKFLKPVKYEEGKIVINCNLNKQSIKTKIKLAKKIKELLNSSKVNTVILSKKIKEDKDFINLIYSNNLNIIDGRNLFKRLSLDIVEYIIKKNQINISDLKIAIMTNNYDKITESIINNMSMKCKNLQIITEYINKFEKIESALYKEGIIINITNNKRKSMRDSDIILNMDFPNEYVNKYNIYEKAIIVSFEEKIKIKKKRFSGSVINWYNATIKNKEQLLNFLDEQDLQKFDLNEIIESFFLTDKIKAKDIYIESLITK